MDPLIYIDNHDQTDPYLNLALEEYAVRHLNVSRHAYLLLYVNDPCVVVGKHQNILEEVNLKTAAQYHIPVIRRISGGGAVYHDQGNLNVSYITRHTLKDFNNYRKFLQPIVEVLESYGLHIDITERNNLHIDGKKVSGNAQFSSQEHMLSHGTLLVDSDISSMQTLLKTSLSQRFHSRSTKSISSTVTNLADHTALPFSIPKLKNDLIKALCGSNPAYHSFAELEWQTIRSWAENRYQSWAWNYGRSPASTLHHTVSTPAGPLSVQADIREGIIRSASFQCAGLEPKHIRMLNDRFANQRYDWPTLQAVIEDYLEKCHVKKIVKNHLNILFFNC